MLYCKKKTSTSPNRREAPLIRQTGWGYYRKRKETDSTRSEESNSISELRSVDDVLSCRKAVVHDGSVRTKLVAGDYQ